MAQVYPAVSAALEDNRFWVVHEINLGENLKNFSERWGDDYNRSNLTGIRSMIVCNGWYANQVSNKDPDMLALCPLHVNLYEKDGQTTILFPQPTHYAQGSAALSILEEVEGKVTGAIDQVANGLKRE